MLLLINRPDSELVSLIATGRPHNRLAGVKTLWKLYFENSTCLWNSFFFLIKKSWWRFWERWCEARKRFLFPAIYLFSFPRTNKWLRSCEHIKRIKIKALLTSQIIQICSIKHLGKLHHRNKAGRKEISSIFGV